MLSRAIDAKARSSRSSASGRRLSPPSGNHALQPTSVPYPIHGRLAPTRKEAGLLESSAPAMESSDRRDRPVETGRSVSAALLERILERLRPVEVHRGGGIYVRGPLIDALRHRVIALLRKDDDGVAALLDGRTARARGRRRLGLPLAERFLVDARLELVHEIVVAIDDRIHVIAIEIEA